MVNVSIVIPLFNKELYIKRAILSILSQTYSSFTCIIIDSSSDRSGDIVREFIDPRIQYHFCMKSNAASARNLGVSLTKSNLIAFMDADDEWTTMHLETLVSLYYKFPEAGLFSTPYIKIRQDGSIMSMIFADIPPPPWNGYIPRYFNSCAKGDVLIHSSACAIRKDIFTQVGGFREDLVYGEDQHLWGRIALEHPIAFSWVGSAIYHTDAKGRTCDIPHHVVDDPLSVFLEEQMMKKSYPVNQIKDFNKYIRRRRRNILCNKLLFNRESEKRSNYGKKNQFRVYMSGFFLNILNVICEFFRRAYNSRIHNQLRKIKCYLHHWYIPTIEG